MRPSKFQFPFKKSFVGFLLLAILISGLVALKPRPVHAEMVVTDIPGLVWNKVKDFFNKTLKKVASKALGSVVQNALNRFAIDSATYLGSGGKGQQPLFVTKGWGEYAKDLADNAAGELINGIDQWVFKDANGKPLNINLCEPSLDVKAKIGLGLNQYTAPGAGGSKPTCTFSKMKESWTNEIDRIASMKSPDYLKKLAGMFDPTGSDLSASLSLMSGLDDIKGEVSDEKSKEIAAKGGFLDVRNIGGKQSAPPGNAESQLNQAKSLQTQSLGKFTGDALVDAANVFLNQLAISAFNNLLGSLTSVKPGTTGSAFVSSLINPDFEMQNRRSSMDLQNQLTKILKPRFDTRGDYDILAQLTICPSQSNIGPTDCVIDDQFRQAVESNQTVIEAIKAGYLNGSWRFKRDIAPNQGYSLRSISILRKYRILPVGWETALIKAESLNQPTTLMDLVSCFDPNDSYSQYSQGFVSGAWCQGLIDPNWVLKAPLNYCKRQGAGGQILDKTFIPQQVDTQDPPVVTSPAQVIITRADSYCADEQSCIKEKSDGTCEAYGYCTEEKRTWNFGFDGCDPVFNSCKSFSRSSDSDNKVAYLENTLDYSTCTVDNAGCQPYSLGGIYSSSTNRIDWKPQQQIYFNKQVETCDQSSESCQEFVKVEPNLGHNILINSDFESSLDRGGWNTVNATTTSGGYFSNTALKLNALMSRDIAAGPSDYNVAGQAYTFSFYAKDCSLGDKFVVGGIGNDTTRDLATSTDWNYYGATYVFPDNINANQVHLAIDSNTCIVDKLKLELGTTGTSYSDYGTNNFIYQKLIPSYLESYCYVNPYSGTRDFSLKSNAPTACNNFARKCNASEVGCDRFSSSDGFSVAAKASASDYCSAECVGYDSYIQKETNFTDRVAANFIPKTATKCSASAAGCSEFTNLDELAKGGEGKEYYISLRQCIKPDASRCGAFYSWGNPGNGGYQLIADTLVALNDEPIVLSDDSALCNAAIYNLPPDHPSYNPDCRQFYNKAGQVFYHLYSHTVSCSDDCHAYRLSIQPDNNVCPYGGTWDTNQGACLYQAIPGEGQSCSASENGCREYNGNYGNNVRNITTFTFENQNDNWTGLCQDGASINTDALNRNGHSLKYDRSGSSCSFNILPQISQAAPNKLATALKNLWNRVAPAAWAQDPLPNYGVAKTIGKTIAKGGSYTIKFLAKANQNTTLKVYLTNGSEAQLFNVASQNNSNINLSGNGQWQLYQASLDNLSHEITDAESIVISASGSLWLDNITLTAITNRYYLIQDSWQTPNSCYYDSSGNYQGVNYNLGCASYQDRNNTTHNLRHFSRLCGDQSVGCKLLVDTKNSADYLSQAFNENNPTNNICDGSDGADCVSVPGDQMIYAIVDPTKSCNATDKGCTRMGKQLSFNPDVAVQNLYSDIYLKNDPNKYGNALCRSAEAGCDAWSADDGQVSYFRDPGNNICEWREPRQTIGMNLPKRWYKKAVNRCDMDNNNKINTSQSGIITESVNKICASDSDCVVSGAVGKCITDNNDYLCPVDANKTIGFGGTGNKVYQPQGMAGSCSIAASGCTEYVDPVSEFSPNMVVNPDWGDTNKDGNPGDSWASTTISGTVFQAQDIYVQKNKLYSLSVVGNNNKPTVLSCPGQVKVLSNNNTFSAGQTTITISATTTKANLQINSQDNTKCTVGGAGTGKVISLRATQVGYQLAGEVDKGTCNGAPKFDSGCIMFNERKTNGIAGLSNLTWNAYTNSYTSGNTESCDPALNNCDSNVLLKVKPDRVCEKWLSCMSKSVDPLTGEETCYALGECDKLSDNGKCQNFVPRPAQSHNFASGSDKNTAGYSKLGYYYLANMYEVGIDQNEHWDFEDKNNPALASSTILALEDLPAGSKVSYPANGAGFLKVNNTSITLPTQFRAAGNTDYFINFLVNIDDSPSGATLKIHSDSYSTSTVIDSGGGWQRKVFKFKFANTGSSPVSVELVGGSGAWAYFDDINIEPVLRANDGTYVAKECRLYPKQDSLTCQSKSQNTVSNGLYGYCLEHDPKNPDVCLMWYPVDSVKSSQANVNATWGVFSDSQYCAKVDGNFDFVEFRQPVKIFEGHTNWGCGGCSTCPNDGDNLGNYGTSAYIMNGQVFTCGSSDYNLIVHRQTQCGDANNAGRVHTSIFCVPRGTPLVPATQAVTLTTGHAGGYNTGSYDFSASTFGWYKYNGPQGGLVRAQYYLVGNNEGCQSGMGCSDVSEQLGILESGSSSVFNPSAYTPKCAADGYVTASVGWIGRLLNHTTFASFFPSPFSNYLASTSNGFYGARKNNSTDTRIGGGYSGAPYGCYSSQNKTYWRDNNNTSVDICNSIMYDNSEPQYTKFKVDPTTAVGMGLGNNNPNYVTSSSNVLKNIFLNLTYSTNPQIQKNYKYSPTNPDKIPECIGSRPANGFCAVKPKIDNVHLYNDDGVEIASNGGIYNITSSGFYTLSFTADIDEEQAPIAMVQVDWGVQNSLATAPSVDERPNSNSPFRFIYYYQADAIPQKRIKIRATDNWGYSGCSPYIDVQECNSPSDI